MDGRCGLQDLGHAGCARGEERDQDIGGVEAALVGGAQDAREHLLTVSPATRPPPFWSTPSSWYSPGLRRSVSTSRTRRPAWAITMPRFTAVVVFPSAGPALVTTSALSSWSISLKLMFARSAR